MTDFLLHIFYRAVGENLFTEASETCAEKNIRNHCDVFSRFFINRQINEDKMRFEVVNQYTNKIIIPMRRFVRNNLYYSALLSSSSHPYRQRCD